MKLSVIMSVYNSEKTIKDAIESILNQSFSDFELLIVNDESRDRSLEIIRNFLKIDKRIKLIENKNNIGLTKSLNKAINIAKGKFIARQDDDDISLPERFELQINFMESNPIFAFCGCNGIIKQTGQDLTNIFKYDSIKKNLILKNCFAHSTIMIKKDIFNKYGLYDESYYYGQDYELWCRLVYKNNVKACNLPDKLAIMNIPLEKLKVKKNSKLLIQSKNQIRTKIRYIKYSQNKIKILLSIFIILFQISFVLIFNKNC